MNLAALIREARDGVSQQDQLTRRDLERLEAELPVLLTERHTAALFDVHPKTVARWSRDGILPPPLLLADGPPNRRRKRYPRDVILRHLAKIAGLLVLLVFTAYALLAVGCRLGIEPARDALAFLQGRDTPICAPGHAHHHHHEHLYALASSADERAPTYRVVRVELTPSDVRAPSSADLVRGPGRARGPPL